VHSSVDVTHDEPFCLLAFFVEAIEAVEPDRFEEAGYAGRRDHRLAERDLLVRFWCVFVSRHITA
jgi:hypothetical protein